MTDATNVSGTLTRTSKQSDRATPHYFSSFQNYCSGPKSKTTASTSSSAKDFVPIPEKFIVKSNEILSTLNQHVIERLADLTQYTSVLPYEVFEQDQIQDGQRYLVDRIMFKMMTDARIINWMPSLKNLYPVRTSGNGNCLLHAVLIAMAGVHDFNLNLRDRLLQFMDKNKEILKSNWKNERLKTDKLYGIQSEDPELDNEWEELCDLVRYENSDDGQATSNLQFLEGVHIFSISNMLARPIIILSEEVVRNKHGEAISYNDLFGIYLPALSRPQDCISEPIVLAYDQSHFCPLQVSNKQNGSSSDNYLPLYQSMDHIHKQTLLPIRFLGNDSSPETVDKLLQTYLRIKVLSHYPDVKSASIPIRCAELGRKNLPEKHDYIFMYYQYLVDFFDTQKKKVQQQKLEEEENRRRQQDYYYSNNLSDNAYPRLSKKTDILSSSPSPPPSYGSIVSTRTSETKPYSTYERRSSYDKAVANENVFEPPSSTAQNYSQSFLDRRPLVNTNNKHLAMNRSDWDSPHDEHESGAKSTSSSNSNSRGNDSRFRQEPPRQTPAYSSVQIPIHFEKTNSPSNLIDFEQKTDRIRPCIVCKLNFDDISSTRICRDCDYNSKHPIRPTVGYQPTTRVPPIYTYPRLTAASDFITPYAHTTTTRLRPLNRLLCRHCNNVNMINDRYRGNEYLCSVCHRDL
ncbi:unnamed protein product [Adineta ricciae]|uniref:OTU domain-containing protein n=1 Tax=Adineta ricciae TaxID=249248 RepID=A0A813MTW1_ADIRI|nr:unnamed protein product [Adineta ricciae]CAF0817765.1 unnamed protein product [Adineta ricciae]